MIRLLFILFLFQNNILLSQNLASFDFNKVWNPNSQGADSGQKTLILDDHILTMGFYYYNSASQMGLSLSLLDTTGSPIWTKNHTLPGYYHLQGNDILLFDSTTIFIVGQAYHLTTGWDPFIAGFTTHGDSLFYHLIKDSTDAYYVSIVKSNDSLFVSGGQSDTSGSLYNRILLKCFNPAGILHYGYTGNNELFYPSQILKYNGTVFVGGNLRTNASSNYNVKSYIHTYNDNLTQRIYQWNLGNTLNEYFSSMLLWQNNIYAVSEISVIYPPNTNTFFKPKIGIIPANSSTGLYTQYDTIGKSNLEIDLANISLFNDTLLIMPLASENNAPSNILYFINPDLEKICEMKVYYDSLGNSLDFLKSIAAYKQSKIAGAGLYIDLLSPTTQINWNFLSNHFWDFYTENCSGPDAVSEIKINHFNFYPNPARNEITVINSETNDFYEIEIYNSEGKIEYIKNDCFSSTKINIRHFRPGIYIIRIKTADKVLHEKLIIQE